MRITWRGFCVCVFSVAEHPCFSVLAYFLFLVGVMRLNWLAVVAFVVRLVRGLYISNKKGRFWGGPSSLV